MGAEINESTRNAPYTNESVPFEKPSNKGKIAVKVSNHYGDAVVQVYEVCCKEPRKLLG